MRALAARTVWPFSACLRGRRLPPRLPNAGAAREKREGNAAAKVFPSGGPRQIPQSPGSAHATPHSLEASWRPAGLIALASVAGASAIKANGRHDLHRRPTRFSTFTHSAGGRGEKPKRRLTGLQGAPKKFANTKHTLAGQGVRTLHAVAHALAKLKALVIPRFYNVYQQTKPEHVAAPETSRGWRSDAERFHSSTWSKDAENTKAGKTQGPTRGPRR
eukprot:GHVT01075953.1.p1 GENE.GHVT01075953.1~~GHVT01075953.1.p1  ORF type:complete len:218 (+),score=32.55 GHVT01075953.1:639-1292(+)